MKIAYDEGSARASLGQLMLEHIVAKCCQRQDIDAVNVGWEADWCHSWRPEQEPIWSLYVGLGGITGRSALWLLSLRAGNSRYRSLNSLRGS